MAAIAIVGYGYWGRNLVRNFHALDECELRMVVEADPGRRAACARHYPSVRTVADFEEALADPGIVGLVIATPVESHYALARRALEGEKHVLVEKPMAHDVASARALVTLAGEVGRVLMVDHTFLYTGAVTYLKRLVDEGALGRIYYIDSTRINLGLFQQDVNVLWDLAVHDVSICVRLLGRRPRSVQATGISHTYNNLENIAYLTLRFEDRTIAHFNCSWISPVKIRMMLIGGDKKMAVFNDMEPTEKLKIYDTGFEVRGDDELRRLIADYRVGDIFTPKLSGDEALSSMARDFIGSIGEGRQPLSDGTIGLQVVEILEAAQRSMQANGREIDLDWSDGDTQRAIGSTRPGRRARGQ